MSATIPPKSSKKSFKQEHSFDKRKAESDRIRLKYPDRVPIICEKAEKSDIQQIDKHKYLCPADISVGQFQFVIRKRIKLTAEQAIFLFVNGVLPPANALLSQVYKEHADSDGFLYVNYAGEGVFGGR